jgi:type II secretory pathway pseudopilin PulG
MVSNKKNNNEKGFSLLEVIIAVGITSFAFVGIMAIFASNIRVELGNRDRITASYLAQEGVEVIRQLRDISWFTGGDIDTAIPAGNSTLSLREAPNFNKGWILSSGADAAKQKIYLADGTYVQTAGAPAASWRETNFRRVVNIVKETDYRIKLTVTVYYGNSGGKMEVVSYIYDNWYNS